ncbi:hypothetical protein [Bradyrhizobium manausense]|uniref:Uncharacterized protein n=1 Tax=Bradyrhizobium manausense TaxID=989370 RepID=A0A0R3D0B2_9BRAD|nr:hypothetical protein [Bradyrhizobium manausense]KRQ03257.1 hypothetical protein AOQ71_31510 [Bradyrhizobium manausense]
MSDDRKIVRLEPRPLRPAPTVSIWAGLDAARRVADALDVTVQHAAQSASAAAHALDFHEADVPDALRLVAETKAHLTEALRQCIAAETICRAVQAAGSSG